MDQNTDQYKVQTPFGEAMIHLPPIEVDILALIRFINQRINEIEERLRKLEKK
jgi:hypothetical protein